MNTSRCSGTGRISKGSLLSTMGFKASEQPSLYFKTLAQEKRDRILKVLEDASGNLNRAAVILGIKSSTLKNWIKEWAKEVATVQDDKSMNPTRRFYEKIEAPWRVKAFDPLTREVCVEVNTPSTTNTLNYTIPNQRPAEY